MTFDDIKEMQISSKKVKEAWLNGRQVYPSEKRIMDSLVCWYDIKRQGCTNESMKSNPVLKDLSGNGHDATCYNFAWSGMSGIGGYNLDASLIRPNQSDKINIEVSGSTVTYSRVNPTLNISEGSVLLYVNITNNDLPVNGEYGIKAGEYGCVVYQAEPANTSNITLLSLQPYETGKFTINQEELDSGKMMLIFGNSVNIPAGDSGSFELLPLYPNALVSDGVDDYAKVTGLPILTKEKGYTVIAKRKWINVVSDRAFVTKSLNRDDGTGAFIIERIVDNIPNTYSYGKKNVINDFQSDITTIAQTSSYYNSTEIVKGDGIDSDRIDLFKFALNNNRVSCIALYSFLLFDRDLTDAEIEWVKKNMVEGDLVLPSYELDPSLIDAWIFSGLRNEDAPASIVGEKGIPLTCNNFAWNEEGSGFKDGALYFDGVDDDCVAYNKLTCDRNVTVIGKRKLTTDEYNQWQNSLNIHIAADLIPIIFLDYYESGFESAYGYKMKARFGDYELYYNNDTDPHTFWATKDLFNGKKYVNKNSNLENGKKYRYNIYLGRVWSGAISACAWYYLAVYDKVMTEQEAQFEIEKLEKIWSNRLNNN